MKEGERFLERVLRLARLPGHEERLFADIIDFLPDATFVINRSGEVMVWNRAMEKLTGIKASEMVGKGNYEYAVPFYGDRRPILIDLALQNDEEAAKQYAFVQRKGQTLVAESFDIKLRGSRLDLWGKASPLFNHDGEIAGAIESIRDITERRRVEEAVRTSEDKLRRVVEYAAEGIVVVQEDRIRLANPCALRLFGATMEQVSAVKYLDLIHSDDRGLIQYRRRRRAGGDKIENNILYRIKNTSNEFIWVEAHATNIDWEEKPATLVFFSDLTERKKAEEERARLEEQLQQASKLEAVGLLAGGVAHDFNNMLAVILGYAEMLRDVLPKDSTFRSDLEEIIKAALRSRDLTHQLLAFARRQALEVKPLDLNRVISGFEKMLRRTIRENVTIVMKLSPSLCAIEGDAGQIEQIILNLALNAQDAMPEGGRLLIETEEVWLDESYARSHDGVAPGPYAMISMSDTGKGIDRETIAKIFDPFFTTKEMGKGTGLGLSTVYGIIKQHRGSINTWSEPGQGTTFRVYLPGISSKPVEQAAPEMAKAAGGMETILVVEDQQQMRPLVCKMLKRQGYKVFEAADGKQALEVTASQTEVIHLLVTDVVMTGMNGRELYDILKKERPGIKVLYMSGYTSDVIGHHGVLDAGVNFIQKPFSLQAFLAKVREVLDQSQRA